MDLAEAVVERFITANAQAGEGIAFVCPQFILRDHEIPNWEESLDFVVLQFLPAGKSRLIVVEVSDSGDLGSIETKATAFATGGYFDRLARQVSVRTNKLIENWGVEFLGFVRTKALAQKAQKRFPAPNMHFRSLEEAFCEGWWEDRIVGLLPNSV